MQSVFWLQGTPWAPLNHKPVSPLLRTHGVFTGPRFLSDAAPRILCTCERISQRDDAGVVLLARHASSLQSLSLRATEEQIWAVRDDARSERLPLVVDPVNPTNNVATTIGRADWRALARAAGAMVCRAVETHRGVYRALIGGEDHGACGVMGVKGSRSSNGEGSMGGSSSTCSDEPGVCGLKESDSGRSAITRNTRSTSTSNISNNSTGSKGRHSTNASPAGDPAVQPVRASCMGHDSCNDSCNGRDGVATVQAATAACARVLVEDGGTIASSDRKEKGNGTVTISRSSSITNTDCSGGGSDFSDHLCPTAGNVGMEAAADTFKEADTRSGSAFNNSSTSMSEGNAQGTHTACHTRKKDGSIPGHSAPGAATACMSSCA